MSGQKRQDVWRNQERHYCSYCNAWMGSDRQSILIHENGKKHRENVETSLKQRRLDKMEEEKKNKALAGMLQQMEKSAAASHAKDIGSGAFAPTTTQHVPLHQGTPASQSQAKETVNEKESWETRKKKREEAKSRKKDDSDDAELPTKTVAKRKIGPDEGHYTIGGTTYLEGPTFAGLLEDDIPIEIWTGFHAANLAEKQLPEKQHLWKKGLVVKTRKPRVTSNDGEDIVADIAYLLRTNDTDETLENAVRPDRLRIVLGADESIPDSLEEARLAAMGGEVTNVEQAVEVDENTGLSSWGTVSIRRTTVHQEQKEERDRVRAKRRAEAERAQALEKEANARRMEEAKVENADDSALGAFDVWSSGKAGYKGVDIHKETKLGVHDTAKSLSKGMGNVEFKKRKGTSQFKKAKKKQNRRTTSADDED